MKEYLTHWWMRLKRNECPVWNALEQVRDLFVQSDLVALMQV
jgi:hypothetical protein